MFAYYVLLFPGARAVTCVRTLCHGMCRDVHQDVVSGVVPGCVSGRRTLYQGVCQGVQSSCACRPHTPYSQFTGLFKPPVVEKNARGVLGDLLVCRWAGKQHSTVNTENTEGGWCCYRLAILEPIFPYDDVGTVRDLAHLSGG